MFDFRWENNISAGRFSQTVFPQPRMRRFPALPPHSRRTPRSALPDAKRARSHAIDFFSKQLFASRRLLFISPPHRRVAHLRDPLLGNSSTVERRTLTPLILVRIQVPQPKTLF